MKSLFLTLFITTFSMLIYAQEKIYSDDRIDVQFTVEELTDEVNDRFYAYYVFEISNTSQSEVSFIPVFKYTTETGREGSSIDHDVNNVIQLAPGEMIKGSLTELKALTLFKEFLPGNSGKRSANSTITIKTVGIQYQ